MAYNLLTKLFGSRNDRLLRMYRKTVDAVNALEAEYETLSDDVLRGKTDVFKGQLASGQTLEELMPHVLGQVERRE